MIKKLVNPEIFFFAFFFFFSAFIMWKTFNIDRGGNLLIGAKVWSDFANHIPLIRSFSFGNNFPPEFPLFPGESIRYHFLFYLIVGLIEKIGIPLNWGLNLPSAISFFLLLVIIYKLSLLLFENRKVGVLATVFFLFNGSLSFLEFFKSHKFSLKIFSQIIQNTGYPSFGPYDGKIVSAFWNLNIYTNQRHLAISLFLLLFLIYLIIKFEKAQTKISFPFILLGGFIIGILSFLHSSIFIMTVIVVLLLGLLIPRNKIPISLILLLGGLFSLPRVFILGKTSSFSPIFNLNYLISEPLKIGSFLFYWIMNLGLFTFLIPLGFITSNKLARKVFLVFLPLFIIGHTIQFSPEIAANHKFFNAFLIVGNILAARFIVYLFERKKIFQYTLVPILLVLTTLSGIIDFFPLKNDYFIPIKDYKTSPDVSWIKTNTPPNSLFLNSSYLYHPASIAGRKIFLGWPYFSWSAGYNTQPRERNMKLIFESNDRTFICEALANLKVNYFTVEDTKGDPNLPKVEIDFFRNNFNPSYKNPDREFYIFSVKENCEE